MRSGGLSQERLVFISYCGSAGATAACAELRVDPLDRPEDFPRWAYLDRTGLSREDQFVVCLAVVERAGSQADRVAQEAESAIGLPSPDSTGRAKLLADAQDWVAQFVLGEVGPLLPRRRLSDASPADQAAQTLREAVRRVREIPRGNSTEAALAKSLTLSAEVLGEEEVKRVARCALLAS